MLARFPAVLKDAIDKWAAEAAVSRSEAMRQLIEAGLKRRTKP
jgi:metal-responsive CopG/Arc/MetJ family transcriptional regulator